jgi:hypothetical protein
MKIHSVGAELFHADGQTYMTNLIVVFSAILRRRLKTCIEFVQSTYFNLFAEKTMGSSTLVESPAILQLH